MSNNGTERLGWIRLHRTIIDSKLWSCSDATFRVAVYLILEANHEPAWHRRVWIERGQTVRSITRISEDCNLSRKATRYALQILQKDGFIAIDEPFGAQQGHRLSIYNYGTYQNEKTNKGTGGAHEGNHEGNTNKNKENKENIPPKAPQGAGGKFSPPSIDQVRQYCEARRNNVDPEAFVDFYASKGWMVGKNKMKDWEAAVRTWEKNRNNAPPLPLDYGGAYTEPGEDPITRKLRLQKEKEQKQ